LKLKYFPDKDGMFVNYECGIAFKNAIIWDNCALLPVQTADFGLSRYSCAHFDRVGYLSPHKTTAL